MSRRRWRTFPNTLKKHRDIFIFYNCTTDWNLSFAGNYNLDEVLSFQSVCIMAHILVLKFLSQLYPGFIPVLSRRWAYSRFCSEDEPNAKKIWTWRSYHEKFPFSAAASRCYGDAICYHFSWWFFVSLWPTSECPLGQCSWFKFRRTWARNSVQSPATL